MVEGRSPAHEVGRSLPRALQMSTISTELCCDPSRTLPAISVHAFSDVCSCIDILWPETPSVPV